MRKTFCFQVQFVILVVNTTYGVSLGCDFPHSLAYTQLAFLGSLVVLFSNFYIQSYIKRKHGGSLRPAQANGKLQKKEL
jgi:GNS1/SUR4 family